MEGISTLGVKSFGSVPEISVFPTEISVSGLEILPYEHFIPVTGMKAEWIVAVRMASSCIACCIFQIISIPFNCSDTALRVTDAKIGLKVKIFVFRYVCLVSRIWCQNSSRKPGWNFSYEPKAKPSQPGQPGLYEEALSVRLKHGKGISYISVWIC